MIRTQLSWQRHQTLGIEPSQPIFVMARSSLLLLCGAMCMSGCLVTNEPVFEEPEAAKQTAPFLDAAIAHPDPRDFVRIPAGDNVDYAFSAAVRSEDAGEDVLAYLYVDYGVQGGTTELPTPFLASNSAKRVPASTMEDASRTIVADYRFSTALSYGCHTITLMASHEFDDRHCPVSQSDASQLTWHVLWCAPEAPCPAEVICPEATTNCFDAALGASP